MTPLELASLPNATSCSAAGITLALFMSLFESERSVSKKVSKTTPDQILPSYDFVIVGGGAAGCVLANRLSAYDKWSVLLLEAGREEPSVSTVPAWFPYLSGTDLDWDYRTTTDNGTCTALGCSWSRGKVLGGTSAIDLLMYVRGNSMDYEKWEKGGISGWNWKEALRLFKQQENNHDEDVNGDEHYHGRGGPLHVQRGLYSDRNLQALSEGFTELGFQHTDVNGPDQLGWSVQQLTSKNGQRRSAYRAFIEPIRRQRTNLHVETRALVTKLLMSEGGKTVTGVEFEGRHGLKTVSARKEVILCAGPVNTPQLLMLSGIGPKDHLSSLEIPVIKTLPVGKRLYDHVTAHGISFSLGDNAPDDSLEQRYIDNILYFQGHKHSGPLTSTGLAQFSAFYRSRLQSNDDPRPDLQFLTVGGVSDPLDPAHCMTVKAFDAAYYQKIYMYPLVLRPQSVGELKLASTDPREQPVIAPAYLKHTRDELVLFEGMGELIKLAETDAFKKAGITLDKHHLKGCQQFPFGEVEYFRCLSRVYTVPGLHPVGTCKMGGSKDNDAVVDSKLRVRGVANLRVADASVIPDPLSGNPNAAVMMIAEKASELIVRRFSRVPSFGLAG